MAENTFSIKKLGVNIGADLRRLLNNPVTAHDIAVKKCLFPVTVRRGDTYVLVFFDRFTGETFGAKQSILNQDEATGYTSFKEGEKRERIPTIFSTL